MDALGKHSTAAPSGCMTVRGRSVSTCLLAWLLCISMTSVVGEWTRYCGTEPSARYMAHGHCGTSLADTLATVCHIFGGYNSRSFGKRAVSSTRPDHPDPKTAAVRTAHSHQQHGDLNSENNPFWSKSKAYSYLQVQKRMIITYNGHTYRQGIVCECCMHRCSLGELYEYCADPAYSVSKRLAVDSLGKRAAAFTAGSSFPLISSTKRAFATALLAAVKPVTLANHTRHGQRHSRLSTLLDGGPRPDGLGKERAAFGERVPVGEEGQEEEAEERQGSPRAHAQLRQEHKLVGDHRLAQLLSIEQRQRSPRLDGHDDEDFDKLDTRDIADRK